MCVCVCVRERERRQRQSTWQQTLLSSGFLPIRADEVACVLFPPVPLTVWLPFSISRVPWTFVPWPGVLCPVFHGPMFRVPWSIPCPAFHGLMFRAPCSVVYSVPCVPTACYPLEIGAPLAASSFLSDSLGHSTALPALPLLSHQHKRDTGTTSQTAHIPVRINRLVPERWGSPYGKGL